MAVAFELPDDIASRLARRAEIEGVSPGELAARVVGEYLSQDPYAFFGVIESTDIAAADADKHLKELGFGS